MATWLFLLAVLLSFAVFFIAQPVRAEENITAIPTEPLGIPYYVQQGDTVYVNETIDISGVMAGVLNLAYYGGYDEETGSQYLLNVTGVGKKAYYRYYIDPEVFGTRLGRWYKWNGYRESNGNTLAFIVRPERLPIHTINQTTNETLQNPNQTPLVLPKEPLLPAKRVSDYVIARGDGFKLKVNGSTNLWIFGTKDFLYDYHSFNGSIDITPAAINTLSPGSYKILIQTRQNGSYGDSPVRYNKTTANIEWFDSKAFVVNRYNILDKSPMMILQKLQTIYPTTQDDYMVFNLEVQDPLTTIDQIDAVNSLPSAIEVNGVSLDNPSYMDVRGYTNAAPHTFIYVKLDPEFTLSEKTMWKDAILTTAEGEIGGEMRTFKAIVPVNMYDMAPGKHFVAAKSALSSSYASASFNVYGNPNGTYIPNKTIRYISGKYGPDEIIPTPTPKVVTQIVTQVVTKVVTVPVTPSNEQVYAQQKIASEKTFWSGVSLISGMIVSGLLLCGGIWYGISIYRRLKE